MAEDQNGEDGTNAPPSLRTGMCLEDQHQADISMARRSEEHKDTEDQDQDRSSDEEPKSSVTAWTSTWIRLPSTTPSSRWQPTATDTNRRITGI